MATGPPKTGAETARRQYGSTYYDVLWKHLLLLGQIIFQGNMLGRPKEMITAKHAETG